MKPLLLVVLLSGCANTCKPWLPPPPTEIALAQSTGNTWIDEFPYIGFGWKCKY